MKNHGFSLISYQKIMVYKNRYKISRNSWGCGNFDDLGQEFLKNSIMMMMVMVSQFFVPVARPAILMVCKQPLQTTTRHILVTDFSIPCRSYLPIRSDISNFVADI